MTLSFVGQDLRNQSFRGCKDLTGADFTDADMRGCDSKFNELAEPDKEKTLKYLDKIGKLANEKEADRDMIGMAIDGILNVVSKAAKLLTPVQAIAEGLRKLLQL